MPVCASTLKCSVATGPRASEAVTSAAARIAMRAIARAILPDSCHIAPGPNRFGERRCNQPVRAAACLVLMRDRYDHRFVGAIGGHHIFDPRAHGLRRADDGATAGRRRVLLQERE